MQVTGVVGPQITQSQMVAVVMKLGLAREKLTGTIDGAAWADLERIRSSSS